MYNDSRAPCFNLVILSCYLQCYLHLKLFLTYKIATLTFSKCKCIFLIQLNSGNTQPISHDSVTPIHTQTHLRTYNRLSATEPPWWSMDYIYNQTKHYTIPASFRHGKVKVHSRYNSRFEMWSLHILDHEFKFLFSLLPPSIIWFWFGVVEWCHGRFIFIWF